MPHPDDCALYDRIYKVGEWALRVFEATGTATGDLAEWPVELGAPVIDGDGIPGNYDLAAGDRPHNPGGPNYRAEGPPEGTVVRILTTPGPLSAPVPSAPAPGGGAETQPLTLW